MKALYFRYHSLIQDDCDDFAEAKAHLENISDNGDGWVVGVYDSEKKIIFLDGFDDIIGADPAKVESRVMRDLKAVGIVPEKIKSLNQPAPKGNGG